MALLSAVSAGNLTAIRSNNNYRALQFVCLVPNTVIVQFHPDAAPTTAVYAEIVVDTPLSGSMSNIRAGMTVIFSTTSDYRESETFRTRVRKVSGTSILYVGENSQTITTSYFITVLDTYEIQERLRKSETLVDWDVTFRKLLPIETVLQSAYVLTNDTVAFTPTAVPKQMDASATSSFTHAWESSNSSDTLNSGGTTVSPNFTLQAGAFRWIRYTFTDSNGNSNYRVMAVWTVPRNYSSVIQLGFGSSSGDLADIRFDAELGWTATVPAWDGIEDVLNRTFCVVASDEWYNDTRQSIRTNINFVGYLQTEDSSTQGDTETGISSETRFAIESFGHQLARQNIAPIRITRVSGTPAAWGQIQNPTPARMLTYHLTEGSTLFNLCSMTVPSDDTSFVGDDISLTNGKALDDIRFMLDVINAELQFDVNGRLDLCRNLNFQDTTARDAAAVVATLSLSDFLSFNYDYDYSKTCSQVTVTGGAYDSSLDRYDLFEAIAPAVARESEGDPHAISNQVLTTDNTTAESITEIGQRGANFFAANNPTWTARGALKDEWHFLLPDVGSWVKFDIAGTDTARGKVFTTSDRWQVVQIGISTNSITGRRQVDYTFRHETQSTGAMIRAKQIQNSTQADIIYFPGTTLEFSGVPTEDGTWYDSQDTQPPSTPNPPEEPECQLIGIRPKAGDIVLSESVATGYVTVTVRGSGQIGLGGDWCYEYDFTASNQGFVVDPLRPFGNYTGGTGWVAEDGTAFGLTARRINIQKTSSVPTFSCSRIEVDFDLTKGTYTPASSDAISIRDGISTIRAVLESADAVDGSGQTYAWDGSFAFSQLYITGNSSVGAVAGGAFTLKRLRFMGSGTNPFGADNCAAGGEVVILGDAFYYSEDNWATATAYDVDDGLYIEDAQPNIPPFSPEHEYHLPLIAVTGLATIQFEFKHASYDLADFSNWNIQGIVCEREDPL